MQSVRTRSISDAAEWASKMAPWDHVNCWAAFMYASYLWRGEHQRIDIQETTRTSHHQECGEAKAWSSAAQYSGHLLYAQRVHARRKLFKNETSAGGEQGKTQQVLDEPPAIPLIALSSPTPKLHKHLRPAAHTKKRWTYVVRMAPTLPCLTRA